MTESGGDDRFKLMDFQGKTMSVTLWSEEGPRSPWGGRGKDEARMGFMNSSFRELSVMTKTSILMAGLLLALAPAAAAQDYPKGEVFSVVS